MTESTIEDVRESLFQKLRDAKKRVEEARQARARQRRDIKFIARVKEIALKGERVRECVAAVATLEAKHARDPGDIYADFPFFEASTADYQLWLARQRLRASYGGRSAARKLRREGDS